MQRDWQNQNMLEKILIAMQKREQRTLIFAMTTFRICSERIHRTSVQVVNIIWPVETELYLPLQI